MSDPHPAPPIAELEERPQGLTFGELLAPTLALRVSDPAPRPPPRGPYR